VARLKETLETLSQAVYERQFREDYEALDNVVQEAAAEAIQDLVENYRTYSWNHPDVKYIPDHGDIWRLKIGQRGQPVDHRIFFDIEDSRLLFLTIQHRDTAYTE